MSRSPTASFVTLRGRGPACFICKWRLAGLLSAKSVAPRVGGRTGWQNLGFIMWTQGGREEVQVPARISPPAQPGWVALAFCFGSVAISGSRVLAGRVEEPHRGSWMTSREQPWRVGAPETGRMVRGVVNRERHFGQKVLQGREVSGGLLSRNEGNWIQVRMRKHDHPQTCSFTWVSLDLGLFWCS